MPLSYTPEQLRAELERRCAWPSTQTAVAREFGVSLSYLNAVVLGTKPAGPKLLAAMELRRELVYVGRT